MAVPDFHDYAQNIILHANDTANNLYQNYIIWLINTKKQQEATVAELLWQIKLISEYVEKNLVNVTEKALAEPLNKAIEQMKVQDRDRDKSYKVFITIVTLVPLVVFAILMGSSFAPAAAHAMVAGRSGAMVSLTSVLRFYSYVALGASVLSHFLAQCLKNEWQSDKANSSIKELDAVSQSTSGLITHAPDKKTSGAFIAVNKTLLSSWDNIKHECISGKKGIAASDCKVDLVKLSSSFKPSVC